MNRVFISYSRKNEAFAERLARDLSDAGLDVWIDLRQIQGGENWRDEIFRGLERAEFLVALLSPSAIASKWVQREILTAREQKKRIYPIMVENARAELKASEQLAWMRDVQYIDFENRYEQAFPDLLEALPGGRPITTYDVFDPEKIPNPFKGLEAFQQRDAAFFFGREDLTRRALMRLRRTPFLAVVGASGSGKSSLVRAGIIPQIRNGVLPDSDTYPVMIFTPGAHPVQSLATRIHPLLAEKNPEYTQEKVAAELSGGGILRLADVALADLPDDSRILLVVDQFEEAFTRAGETERADFLHMLKLAATSAGSRVMTILTMRADFFGHLSRYPDLAALFEQDNLLIVTEMTTANLLRAIEGPAEAVGLVFEEGLVDSILDEVKNQPGTLPLLQYALRELYTRRDGVKLTQDAYEDIGGVRKALARHAESIFQNLDEEDQELTRRILLRLVEVGESGEATRRRIPREELSFRNVEQSRIQSIVDHLTAPEARLLIASREIKSSDDAPVTWLEVSHEALIREWDRFKSWVTTSAEDLRYESDLRKLVADWLASDRDNAYLLRGKRLMRAEVWLEDNQVTEAQREFIQTSLRERRAAEQREQERLQRELTLQQQSVRRARIIIGVVVLLLILAAGSLVAILQSRSELADSERELAEINQDLVLSNDLLEEQRQTALDAAAEARSLAVASSAVQAYADGDVDLAVSLALAAGETGKTPPQAERALADVALSPGTRALIELPARGTAVAGGSDGRTVAVGLQDGLVLLLDANTKAVISQFAGHDSSIEQIAMSPAQRYIAAVSGSLFTPLRIWDTETGDAINTGGYGGNLPEATAVTFLTDDLLFIGNENGEVTGWRIDDSSGNLVQILAIPDFTGTQATISTMTVHIDEMRPDDPSSQSEPPVMTVIAGANTGDILVLRRTAPDAWQPPESFRPVANKSLYSLSVDRTGSRLLAGYLDGSLLLVDVEDENIARTYSQLETPIANAFFLAQDAQMVIVGRDNRLRILDTSTGVEIDLYETASDMMAATIGQDKRTVFTTSRDDTLRVWDVFGNLERARFNDGYMASLAVKPDGTEFVSGATGGQVIVRTVTDQAILQNLSAGGDTMLVSALTYNLDGSQLAIGGSDGTISLRDAGSYAVQETWTAHDGRTILALAYHPGGQILASGAADGRIILWDLATLDPLVTLEDAAHDTITALAFNQDGSRLVSSAKNASLLLWDLDTNSVSQTFAGHTETIRSVDISQDGSQIVSGSNDDSVRVWDVRTGQELRRFTAHDNAVLDVSFIGETLDILSGSSDGTLRLWDAESGLEVRRVVVQDSRGQVQRLRTMAASPDGELIATALTSNTTRLWSLVPGRAALTAWTRQNRHVRDLTCIEQLQFSVVEGGGQVFVDEATTLAVQGVVDGVTNPTIELAPGTPLRLMSPDDDLADDSVQVCTTDGLQGTVSESSVVQRIADE